MALIEPLHVGAFCSGLPDMSIDVVAEVGNTKLVYFADRYASEPVSVKPGTGATATSVSKPLIRELAALMIVLPCTIEVPEPTK